MEENYTHFCIFEHEDNEYSIYEYPNSGIPILITHSEERFQMQLDLLGIKIKDTIKHDIQGYSVFLLS